MKEWHLRTERVKPLMNTDERRFNPATEFGEIIHRKGCKERKVHRMISLRQPFSCVREKTFYNLYIRKTTEGTEDTEKKNKSLCSLCSLWSIILTGVHSLGKLKSVKKGICLSYQEQELEGLGLLQQYWV